MISVIISKENIDNNLIKVLEKSEVNHLKNVFRIKKDDVVRAVDLEKEYICKVVQVEKKEIVLQIEKINEEKDNQIKIDAGIGILKNDKMDLTIQKLTEIGIDKIIPIMTKRSVVKITEKKDKWDLIVKESLKQCQGIKPLEIGEVTKIQDINFGEYDLIVVPYECEEEKTLKNLLKNIDENITKILYIIGSEGGFDKEEIELLQKNNAKIVTLGKRILRAETASIVVGGILVNEFR